MIAELASKLVQIQSGGFDGDFADRVNFKYTTLLFIVLGVLVTTRQFVGDAIVCFTPHEFDGQRSAYADAYCWVSNTYFLPLDSHHDPAIDEVPPKTILYYQWTPLILFLQAVSFAFPHFVWRAVYTSAGVDFEQVVETASKFETSVNSNKWNDLIQNIALHIDRYLELQKDQSSKSVLFLSRLRVGHSFGNLLTFCYPLVKLGFILNIVAHVYALKYWLGQEYLLYGYTVIYSFIYLGTSLREVTDLFPRITWCTVQTRVLEKVFDWQIHCVLPINLFNEMVYLLVWFWLLFILILTSLNLVSWLFRMLNCCGLCGESVFHYLELAGKTETKEQRICSQNFVRYYLKADGLFIMHMFAKNSTKVFMVDFIEALFDIYMARVNKEAEPIKDTSCSLHNNNKSPSKKRSRNYTNTMGKENKDRNKGHTGIKMYPTLDNFDQFNRSNSPSKVAFDGFQRNHGDNSDDDLCSLPSYNSHAPVNGRNAVTQRTRDEQSTLGNRHKLPQRMLVGFDWDPLDRSEL